MAARATGSVASRALTALSSACVTALAACAGDLPAVAFTTRGQRERDDSPGFALPAHASPKPPSPRAPAICPPDVALAMHAGDLPTVAFSARGHRERDDSHAVALATRDSYSPDVALTGRR